MEDNVVRELDVKIDPILVATLCFSDDDTITGSKNNILHELHCR